MGGYCQEAATRLSDQMEIVPPITLQPSASIHDHVEPMNPNLPSGTTSLLELPRRFRNF